MWKKVTDGVAAAIVSIFINFFEAISANTSICMPVIPSCMPKFACYILNLGLKLIYLNIPV